MTQHTDREENETILEYLKRKERMLMDALSRGDNAEVDRIAMTCSGITYTHILSKPS